MRYAFKTKETVLTIVDKKIIKILAIGSLVVVVTVAGLFILKDINIISTVMGFISKELVVEGASFNLIDIPKEVIVEGIRYIK